MLKSRLGLFAVAAATVCSFALLAVKDSVKPVSPAEASAETADAASKTDPPPATQPATKPASDRIGRKNPAVEQESIVMAWLKTERPRYYKLMRDLKETDPRRYNDRLPVLAKIMRRQRLMSPEMRQATNDERDKQVMVAQIAGRMRRTSEDSARAELEKQLVQAISIHFDAEQARRETQLNELEAQIRELRAELGRMRKDRQKIIAERLQRWLKVARPITAKAPPAK